MKLQVEPVSSLVGLLNVFTCPLCGKTGRFKEFNKRKHAQCRKCRSLERHRLQYLVLNELFGKSTIATHTCVQFAPDPMTPFLKSRFKYFFTADVRRDDVDVKVDMRAISLETGSVDFVFASHVLEHIDDDVAALEEVYRILRPGGLAILPVPIVAERTIEYPKPSLRNFSTSELQVRITSKSMRASSTE